MCFRYICKFIVFFNFSYAHLKNKFYKTDSFYNDTFSIENDIPLIPLIAKVEGSHFSRHFKRNLVDKISNKMGDKDGGKVFSYVIT